MFWKRAIVHVVQENGALEAESQSARGAIRLVRHSSGLSNGGALKFFFDDNPLIV